MTSSQIANAWNECFDYKITVLDCKKPTQAFMLDVLQCFLRYIHIDCTKLKAKMDERQFKITLVKYFHEFLKSTDDSKTSLYGDLIYPEPKKTRTILQFLTNYYGFFGVVETDVIGAANEKIALYNTLLSKKTQLQLKHEEAKIQSENKKEALMAYTALIAENKQLLQELNSRNALLIKETVIATQQLNDIRNENVKLNYLKNELLPSVVTPAEVESLLKKNKEVDDTID